MTRPSLTIADLKQLKPIAKALVKNLPAFDTDNPDKLKEIGAKCLHFNDFNEAQKCAGKGPVAPAGSISRASIQLYVAVGLSKLTGISIVEAFFRARSAGLERLSFDLSTIERRLEDEAVVAARANGTTLSSAELHRLRHPLPKWHDQRARFVENGAPPFEITVRSSGAAFHWETMTAFFDAIQASNYKQDIIDPVGWATDEVAATTSFIRNVLIPQCWVPIPQLIQGKLFQVPDHEVVYLFDEKGYYIGRAIRHTKHGSFMPRLLLTEEEVWNALSFVIRGSYLQGGSSLTQWLTSPPRYVLPVYTLKPGVEKPKPIHDPYENLYVPVEDLDLVPGVRGVSWTLSQPSREAPKAIWMIGGRSVYKTIKGFPSRAMPNYYESEPWLREADLPGLFPHRLAAGADPLEEESPFKLRFEQRSFLPEDALDVQERALRLLERTSMSAQSRVEAAVASGELAKKLEPEMLERVGSLTDQVLVAKLHELGTESQVRNIVGAFRSGVVDIDSQLDLFGPYSLWAALVVLNSGSVPVSPLPDAIASKDVLVALATLQCAAVSGHDIEFCENQASTIAIAEWLDGVIRPAQVSRVAAEYQRYRHLLDAQAMRISSITHSVAEEDRRRTIAADHGFLYVGEEVPRAKPIGTK